MRMAPGVVRPVGLARDGMGRLGSSWMLAKTTPVDGWPGDHAALTATRCFRPRGAREDLLPIFEVIQLAHGQAPPEGRPPDHGPVDGPADPPGQGPAMSVYPGWRGRRCSATAARPSMLSYPSPPVIVSPA
jgi:hypothetical protein